MAKLIVVPTPIGNLEDMTHRAIRLLMEADAVLAEDTRTTQKLFSHYNISNKLIAYHLNNEHKIVDRITDEIEGGLTYALVSDAGTPGISDPGFLLIRNCVERGIEVECLPGPTAFVPALVVSGLPCEKFVYEGFLPHKKGRQTRIERIAQEDRTVVLYESPHRILKLLHAFAEQLEYDRQLVVCRELSKKFEEIIRGTASELVQHFENNTPKGEFVVVIAPKK